MLGRTNAGGGGSGGFGLQIVEGLVRPKNPTQGMIWAKTEHKVTYYDLSATKPENPVEGTLCISISDSGDKKIVSPVSKEWITVYPLSAEQYISGEWMSIETMSDQDGEWVYWIHILYEIGNEHVTVTGGWSSDGWTTPYSGYPVRAPAIDNSGITLKTVAGKDSPTAGTANKIDLSKYKTIWVTVESINQNPATHRAYVGVNSEKKVWNDNDYPMIARAQITKTGDIPLPVEGIDSGYIAVFGYSSSAGIELAKITKIWME